MAKDPNRMPSPWDDPNQGEDTQNQNPGSPDPWAQPSTSGTQTAESPVATPTAPAKTPGFNRSKFGDAWAASPGHGADDLTALINNNPDFATGVQRNSADKVTLPGYTEEGTGIQRGPESLDLIGDVGGKNTWGWSGMGGDTPAPASAVPASSYTPAPSAAQTAPTSPAAPTAHGVGASAGTDPMNRQEDNGTLSPTTGGAKGQYDDAIHAAIQKMLGQGPVSENDPAIAAQFAPVARTLQRGAQRTREQAAERLAQQGLNQGGSGGALDATVNSINEGEAGQEGQLMSKLTGQEMQARRQDIVNALGVAQGEEKIQLTSQLAALDRELQKSQMAQQNSQFGQTLAQSGSQFDRSLAQGGSQFDRNLAYMLQQLTQSGALANRGLDIQSQGQNNQNQQFYDNFGRLIGRDQVNDNQWLYDKLTA